MRFVATGLALVLLAWGCSGTANDPVKAADNGDAGVDSDAEPLDEAGQPLTDARARDGASDAKLKDGSPSDGGRYGAVESLQDNALRIALRDMLVNHTSLGYDGARDVMLGVTGTFDLTGGMLECIYTGRTVSPDGTRTPNGFNTEHSWPQSLGASTEPARSDLHHLFPVDENANNARGSLPFGETNCSGVSCNYENGGSQQGVIAGGSTNVFEVRAVRRGDIARALFYFAVRYDKALDATEEATLRTWNDSDPPDTVESDRNDAIEGYQKNRNPFVDRPDFVARISDF